MVPSGTISGISPVAARCQRAENLRHLGNVPPQNCYPVLNHAFLSLREGILRGSFLVGPWGGGEVIVAFGRGSLFSGCCCPAKRVLGLRGWVLSSPWEKCAWRWWNNPEAADHVGEVFPSCQSDQLGDLGGLRHRGLHRKPDLTEQTGCGPFGERDRPRNFPWRKSPGSIPS